MPSKSRPEYDYVPVISIYDSEARIRPPQQRSPLFAREAWTLILLFAISSLLLGGLLGFKAGKASSIDVRYDIPCAWQPRSPIVNQSGTLTKMMMRGGTTFNRIRIQPNISPTTVK